MARPTAAERRIAGSWVPSARNHARRPGPRQDRGVVVPLPRIAAAASVTSAATETAAPPRVAFLDDARGLFLFWMVVVHALGLFDVRHSSPLAWLLPPPTVSSSERFVVLSGFTAAWILASGRLTATARARKLRRRAAQLIGIAYVSNLLSLLLVDAMTGQLSADGATDALLLGRPWTISVALLPMAVFLAFAPPLFAAAERAGALAVLVVVTMANIGWQHLVDARAVVHLTTGWPLHVDITELTSAALFGAWGFALALSVRHWPLVRVAGIYAAGSLVTLAVMHRWAWLPHFAELASRFGLMLGTAALVTAAPSRGALRAWLQLLGRNSLLVFLAHRLLEQAQRRTLGSIMGSQEAATVVAASTVVLLIALCRYRESNPRLSAGLKRVGL